MDDASSDILNAVDESAPPHDGDATQNPEKDDGKDQSRSRWRGLSALKAQASIQDKLLEKLLHQVIPTEDLAPGGHVQDTPVPADSLPSYESTRPPFAMATMATNFTRFNARIGVVFKFQSRAIRLLSWRRPSQTLSLLAVYTLVCLDPYLLTVLPLAAALAGVFIPSFMARHPSDARELAYSPRGPPRAPARTVRPARQMSSHFMRNMRDLQNCMEDFSRGHDQVVAVVVPKTNFSDEALSSGLFVALFGLTLFMTIAAHLLPWRAIALCGGWAAVASGHPAVANMMRETQAAYFPAQGGGMGGGGGGGGGGGKKKTTKGNAGTGNPPGEGEGEESGQQQQQQQQQATKSLLDAWVAEDIILDSAPETREVEIFELQHRDASSGEWEPWVFSPSPYDPLSQARITGDRPRGTRFFEDVLAPEGWEWSDKKWALDLWSREWVEERIITGVEVETEGERWVYDMFSENEAASGVREHVDAEAAGNLPAAAGRRTRTSRHLSWEEGEEGEGRRGEWRRRRWVRLVRRRMAREAT